MNVNECEHTCDSWCDRYRFLMPAIAVPLPFPRFGSGRGLGTAVGMRLGITSHASVSISRPLRRSS